MLFKEYHIPMIRSGSKWATRREWADNYAGPSVGTVVAATTDLFVSDEEADCYIQIVNRYEQPLGEMDDEDARREGDYEDLEEFRDGYENVYGEGSWDSKKVVDVVEFQYVGRERPEEQAKLVTDGGRWFAEDLRWNFEHDPVMRCPECDDGPVNAEELLKGGWASCHHCGAEYSASVTLESEVSEA